ncbi:Eco57I restriction-modification methylase domain-containing protein [Achromobacter xylosoxidans]|jgi:adenine-specific DNA-methyltransferase|uniref:Eco57I restriction-modification methylase domain-containing protein n=1 Tax=Alcaligenes xylosoxydans xylosoxydans TaxID=85698 RepID=UPI0006C66923|nr:Eco57I restriction-modification methylase domain-containing protein [Achromobacter xylosoxidans]QQE58954.1 Eco57I restriction-modification methylase domain-containing protein [Achromobacter xylosoxidans]QQV12698.1 Eco57I restriction-modification methylase domain-containing protein [Achromobacter xylosoxidans]UXL02760.1 BREX-1 system adenine-specific DNA-methyltransferase PglX [Achromobacter xylosoxidans]CUJ18160.1 Type I restriction-modification system methyltransferase subunit [Achromobacte
MIPAEKQAFMQRVHSLKKLIEKSNECPSVAVRELLYLWQGKQFPLLITESTIRESFFTKDKLINELADWLTLRPFLESAFWLSSAYAIWVGDNIRSERSLYFTPPILADRLIDNLVAHGASLTDHVWMDPACGGGAFLAPVAVRMVRAMAELGMSATKIVERVSHNLIGNDVDETLVFLSSQFLLMALYDQLAISVSRPSFKIYTGDGLSSKVCNYGRVNVVICNPPYRKMKSIEVRRYIETFGDVIKGQPNIYGLFIRQCLKLGKKGAVVGLLTPTSYLSGSNFSKLRRAILKEATVCQLDMVDDRVGVFMGVSQGAVLSIYKREIDTSFRTEVYKLDITGSFTSNGKCMLADCADAWAVPRDIGDQKIIQQAASSRYRLQDYGYSPRVGTYVDYRDTRKTYTKKPNNKKMRAVFPILWSSDITTEGTVLHGRTSKEDRHHTYIEMGSGDHRAIIRRPAVALQRVTSPDQPRRLVGGALDSEFFEVHGGVVGENHVIFLEKVAEDAKVSVKELVAILASEPIDRLFRSISGAVNVSVSELNQLALPDPAVLVKFLKKGFEMNKAVRAAFKNS